MFPLIFVSGDIVTLGKQNFLFPVESVFSVYEKIKKWILL